MAVFKHMKPDSLFVKMGLLLISIILFSFNTTDTRSQYRIPRVAYSVAAGDIDLDGDNDIVVGHKFSSQTNWGGFSIIENTGGGYFQLSDSLYIDNGFPYINSDQFDDNDYLDFFSGHVTADPYTVYIGVIYNYGMYQFDSVKSYLLQHDSPVHYFNSGDINNDYNNDIVFASHNGQFWGYMLNDGSGNFATPFYIYVQDYYPSDIACADLNDDGWDDVVLVGQQKTEVYFSYPGTFTLLELESDLAHKISIADFDQDGDNDILTIGTFFGTFLVMHENMGNNTFSAHDVFAFQALASRFFISDFNNDSFPDLLFQLDDNTGYVIYYNQGNFQLGDSLFIAVEPHEYEGLRNCYCSDLDGNNFNDIVITRLAQVALPDNLVVLFNDGNGNFVENPVAVFDAQIAEPENPLSCYPNPFSNRLTIEIKVEHSYSDSKIEIFDIKGNLVRTFEVPGLVSNNYTISWDGKDYSGNMIKPGIYIVRVQAGGNTYTQRVVKIPY